MNVIWVHHDCLHRASPAYRAYPDAPSVFVWDDERLRRDGWSMKRIGFIYECLLDLPVTIRRGDPVTEVRRFMHEVKSSKVVTMATPDADLTSQAKVLGAESLPCTPLISVKGRLDLARFSRYWRKAEPELFGNR